MGPCRGISIPSQWDSSDVLNANAPKQKRGIFHWTGNVPGVGSMSGETFGTISDGTSNTLMVGEYTTITSPRRTTFWAFSYTSYALSAATPESRTLIANYDLCASQGDSNPCKRAFGAMHPGGVIMFVRADGSVNPLQTSLDMNIYLGLSTVAGGEVSIDPN